MDYSDQILIAYMQAGGTQRERSVRILFDRHTNWVPVMCRQYRLNEDDVLSAYLDAIMALHNQVRMNRFRGASSIKTYLYTIFKNKCLDLLRKESSSKVKVLLNESLLEVYDEYSDLVRAISNREELERVKRCFGQQGKFCKHFLLDIFFNDFNTEELKKKYQMKDAKQIRNRKHKCMEKFRKLMGLKK